MEGLHLPRQVEKGTATREVLLPEALSKGEVSSTTTAAATELTRRQVKRALLTRDVRGANPEALAKLKTLGK